MKCFFIFLKTALIGVVLCTTSFPLFCQSYYDKTNAHLKERIEHYNKIIQGPAKENKSIPYSTKDFTLGDDTITNLIDEQVGYQKRAIRNQWGLQLSGGYTYNSTFAPIDEDFFAYKNKAQATISWDLMNAAILGVRPKLNQVELEGSIEKIRIQNNRNNFVYEQIISEIEAKYEKIDLGLQLVRRDLLTDLQNTYEIMYRNSDAKLETLYEINHEKSIVESAIAQKQDVPEGETFDVFKDDFDFSELYLVVDSLMIKAAYATNTENNISEKEIELLHNKIRQTKYINDINLSPFVRYQYMTYPGDYTNRSNFQAGINLTLPISGHYKSEKQAMRLKQNISENQINHNKENINHNAYQLLKQHKKQIAILSTDFHKLLGYKLLFHNSLHTTNVKPNSVNGLDALKVIDFYIKQLIDYFSDRESYEKQLAAIQLFLNGTPLEDFCVTESFTTNINTDQRSSGAYVWTRQHAVEPAKYIAEQLWANAVSTAYIGYSIDHPADHYNLLIEEISKYGIQSELCLSSIKLSLEENQTILNSLDKLLSVRGFSGIQLDIEPHQREDWDSHKAYYLDHLENMVKVTSEWCAKNNKTLSIALPYTYPESFYESIVPYVNNFIVMMYNKKTKTIIDSLAGNAFFGNKTNHYRIAIRPEDFMNQNDDDYKFLLNYEQIKGIDIESLATLTAVKLFAPKIKSTTKNNYSLTLDNTVNKLPLDQVKAKIGSMGYKALSTKDYQGNTILEISNIPTQKEAVKLFGTLIREK